MRKLLCALLFAFVSFCATAQNAKNVLEIDPASFRPVQTGTLSGVAIDKIAKDRSQRECARIKLHVNRMTREEIEQLQVHIIGGMVALTKRELAYEGNGLIIEMTAKPQTRFYLHHDKYGDSNEVTVDLEGNKEYFLDAHLNYYYSITVRSNTADVEVYLDGVLRGRTNSNNLLTVEKVFPGEHRLQMKYGGSDKEKIINVNSQEVFFEQYVDIAGRIPQDVVFEIRPVTAVLKFEGEILPLDEGGAALKTVAQGTYKYSIEADEYHPYSGTVTVEDQMVRLPIINLRPAFGYLAVEGSSVRDAKLYVDSKLVGTLPLSAPLKLASGAHEVQIVKAKYKGYSTTVNISDDKTETITPTLEANFANVTLTASEGVEIVINNQSRGTGRWSGELAMGQYRVECRKAGHKPSQQSLNISSAAPVALRLNDPEPIYGSMRVVSNPLLGMVKIDGRTVGETPRNVERLLVGKHTVEVSKSGYRTWSREITVTEGPMQTITATLEKIATATPTTPTTTTTSTSTSTSWSSSNTSGKTYKVGDYYNDGKKEGVVFWVDESGKYGKIVSLTESPGELRWSSDKKGQKRLIGADDKNNGANNMAKVKQIPDWQSKYPAFKWCADLGEGWYLPAIEELKIFALNTSVYDAVNHTLAAKGIKQIVNRGDSYRYYWSSTEYNARNAWSGYVHMNDGNTNFGSKSYDYYVLAVAEVNFEVGSAATTQVEESKPALASVSQPSKRPSVKKGFQSSVTLGVDIDTGKGRWNLIDMGINYIAGYRVSNGFFVGAGMGLNFVIADDAYPVNYLWMDDDFERFCPAPSKVMIPLYLHLRTYLTKSKCQPFLAVSGGTKFGLRSKPKLFVDVDGATIHAEPYSPVIGFIEPVFGLNFRGKKDKVNFYLQMGGLIQMRPYYRPLNSTQGALSRKAAGGLAIKMGWTF